MRKIRANTLLSLHEIGELHGWQICRSSQFNQEVKRILGKPKTAKISPADIVVAYPDYDLQGILHCLNSKKKVCLVHRGFTETTWSWRSGCAQGVSKVEGYL